MKKMAQPVAALALGFLVLAIWRSPATAAADISHVLGNVGTFLQEVLQKLSEFIGSFGGS
ncbi:hypothetical protein [Dermatobacter hominis]|uniref:hypothetical protein n=1 Tax=Dermatobacter hominis TaxID=2884263 RepID=UPI001D128222|nr:hypothetical protein [Dermatobacter hominis]UDY37331.1 hypothetical protein LH044_07280 [Dermatobacter hominis]